MKTKMTKIVFLMLLSVVPFICYAVIHSSSICIAYIFPFCTPSAKLICLHVIICAKKERGGGEGKVSVGSAGYADP